MIPKGPYMDMHTHILPGIDDGSQNIEQTANMLRQAYDEGIRVIVATPHYGIRNPGLTLSKATEALAETQKLADEIVPGLKLILGCELYYTDGIADALERGEAPTMGGTKYALVEFSTRDSRDRIEQCIREFTWKGFRPIIAHIERYRSLEGDIDAVRDLVSHGAAVQINCRSFMDGAPAKVAADGTSTGAGIDVSHGSNDESGHNSKGSAASQGHTQKKGLRGLFAKPEKQTNRTGFFLEQKGDWARALLAEGLVHFIGSDCHDDQFRNPVYRSALEAMDGCCSDEILANITRNNVIKLIRNEKIV